MDLKSTEEIHKDKGVQSYARIIFEKFKQNRTALISLRIFYFLGFVALFADFLANEKPIVCTIEGETHFPIIKKYSADLNLGTWDPEWINKKWKKEQYDWVIWPLVTYSPDELDRSNTNYAHPFKKQQITSWRFSHWMGTDVIGRDVASGLIHGTRTALQVGIISMSIALIIGLLLGSIAGFFGDNTFRVSVSFIVFLVLGLIMGIFWGFYSASISFNSINLLFLFFKGLVICGITIALFLLLSRLIFEKLPILKRKVYLPADLLIMRLIEIFNSIPGLLLLMALIAILSKPSIWSVVLIIGLISWTNIAKFVRAEMLRIKNMEYILAGKALGFNRWYILFKHALPNAIGPVLIVLAFGIANSILLEATLSFIGLGTSSSEITWGKLLNAAQNAPKAWWLAVFPGSAIFLTVTIFNLIGEGLSEAMDSKEIN